MSEIIFKSICPVRGCNDDEIQTWHHTGCPSDSHEYISDQAIVRCDYCGKKWDFLIQNLIVIMEVMDLESLA